MEHPASADRAAYVTRLPDGRELSCRTAGGVFYPTYTSELFIRAVAEATVNLGKTLDLGCGCGILGVAAAKLGKVTGPVYASDLSETATTLADGNFETHGVQAVVRAGELLEPWVGEKFDTILDDVSGISSDVAPLSPWYGDGVPCASGPDGTGLTRKVLAAARSFLNPGGALYFPVISLSATEALLDEAAQILGKPERVASQKWMLPTEMLAHRERLRELKAQGRIRFEEKYGTIFCWTEIYRCGI